MSTYTAQLLPYKGKYYGTKVGVKGFGILTFWFSEDLTPSHRELALWDEEEIGEPWNVSDSHFESATALRVAEAVVRAINEE